AAGAAAQAHGGRARIVDEDVRLLLTGPLPAQGAVTVEGVGRPGAVEEPFRRLGAPEGPLALFAPPVFPHDKDAHRRIVRDPVLDAPEPVIEPAELPLVDAAARFVAEIPPRDDLRPGDVMPGPDEEPLAVPGRLLCRALAQAPVVADAPIKENVVPPGDMERRNAHLRVAALDAPPLPVLVARGMLEPVEEPGRDPLPAEQRVLLDGQRAE